MEDTTGVIQVKLTADYDSLSLGDKIKIRKGLRDSARNYLGFSDDVDDNKIIRMIRMYAGSTIVLLWMGSETTLDNHIALVEYWNQGYAFDGFEIFEASLVGLQLETLDDSILENHTLAECQEFCMTLGV